MYLFVYLVYGVLWKAVTTVITLICTALFALFLYSWKEYYNTAELTNNLRKTYSRNIDLKIEYQQNCCSCYGIKGVWNIFFWKYLYCYSCCGCRRPATIEATSEERLPFNNKPVDIIEHDNFCKSKRCKEVHTKTTPVIFLIVLDWSDENTKLKNYLDKENKADCHVDILRAAIYRKIRVQLTDTYNKGVTALTKDTNSICLVLKDFPVDWRETQMNPFLRQVDNFIEENHVQLMYTW